LKIDWLLKLFIFCLVLTITTHLNLQLFLKTSYKMQRSKVHLHTFTNLSTNSPSFLIQLLS
jgi:hypothetical protein